jgi:hypothetical protein
MACAEEASSSRRSNQRNGRTRASLQFSGHMGVRRRSMTRARVRLGCRAVGHSPGRRPDPGRSAPAQLDRSEPFLDRGRLGRGPCGVQGRRRRSRSDGSVWGRGPRAGSPWTPRGPRSTICRHRGRATPTWHNGPLASHAFEDCRRPFAQYRHRFGLRLRTSSRRRRTQPNGGERDYE